jgi:hypothetical protein
MGDYRYARMMVAGDPGIFGAIGRVVGGAVKGFITGGPVGAITGAAGGAVSATVKNVRESTLAAGGSHSAYTPALRAAHARALAKGTATAPVGSSLAGTPHGRLTRVVSSGGGVSGGSGRRRRMNVYNPKALSRAGRRMGSFLHHVRKFIKLTHPKVGGVHLKFPKKKRRAA